MSVLATKPWVTTPGGMCYRLLADNSYLLVKSDWIAPGRIYRWLHLGPSYDYNKRGTVVNAAGEAATPEQAMQRADEYLHTTGESTQDGA